MEKITIAEVHDIIRLIFREWVLGSITDMLTSIRYNIYDNKGNTLGLTLTALESNFREFEKIQYDLIYNTPKFGNDDDYADQHAVLGL